MKDFSGMGRFIVLTVVWVSVLWRAFPLIVPFVAGAIRQYSDDFAALLLTVGLMTCLWLGQSWARWTTVLLLFIWGLHGVAAIRGYLAKSEVVELTITAMFVAFCFTSGCLLTISQRAKCFLADQNARMRIWLPDWVPEPRITLSGNVKHVVFSLIPVTALIALPELAFRFYELDRPQLLAPRLVAEIAGLHQGDDELFWVLRPNLKTRFGDQWVFTNSSGFRCPEFGAKAPNEIRILSLGESTTFGAGVGNEDTYSAQLEDKLNEPEHRGRFRVINAGVSAYTSFQSLNFLKTRGLKVQPDVVLFYHEYNDSLRTVVREGGQRDEFALARTDKELHRSQVNRISRKLLSWSATFRFISYYAARVQIEQPSDFKDPVQNNVEGPDHGRIVQTRLPVRVPPEHRIENLHQLLSVCQNNHVRLVIIHPAYSHTDRHECELTRFCAEQNVPMFEAFDILRADFSETDSLFLDGVHPNKRGHELLASGLARFLIDAGIVGDPSSIPTWTAK